MAHPQKDIPSPQSNLFALLSTSVAPWDLPRCAKIIRPQKKVIGKPRKKGGSTGKNKVRLWKKNRWNMVIFLQNMVV